MVTGSIEDKKRWWRYTARVKQLPENYRTTVQAIEQYLMHFVPADGDSAASEFEDLADLFERAAADGTPIREIVGDDPRGVRRDVCSELHEGRVCPRSAAGTADQRHQARRRR